MSLTLVSCDQALSLRVSLQRTVSGHTVQALQQLRLSLVTRRSTGALLGLYLTLLRQLILHLGVRGIKLRWIFHADRFNHTFGNHSITIKVAPILNLAAFSRNHQSKAQTRQLHSNLSSPALCLFPVLD